MTNERTFLVIIPYVEARLGWAMARTLTVRARDSAVIIAAIRETLEHDQHLSCLFHEEEMYWPEIAPEAVQALELTPVGEGQFITCTELRACLRGVAEWP